MDPWTYINISPTGDKTKLKLYDNVAELPAKPKFCFP